MKKIFLLAAIILFFGTAHSQTTKTVGTGGDYSSLKLAFDAINSGSITGDIILYIISDITDNQSAILNAPGTGAASYTSVLVRPGGTLPVSGYWTLTANIDEAMINLNGARFVTIDGRFDGSGYEANLHLINNAATSLGEGIIFQANAIYNTLEFCHIECNNTASSGAIYFGLGLSSSQGNCHNIIDHCDITHTSSGVLNMGISSESEWNNRNVVKNCNISDWQMEGIKLNPNCGRAWIIGGSGEGNNFYQTASFSAPGIHYAVHVSGGDSLVISGNNIGGGSPNAGDPVWSNTNSTDQSYGIYVSGNAVQTCYIQGNRLMKMNLAGTGYTCIETEGINAYIGNEMGNIIGGMESSGEIKMSGTGSLTAIRARADAGAPDFHISSNMIQQLKISNTSNSQAVYGISVSSSLTGNLLDIENNSIQQLYSNGNSSGLSLRGIGITANYASITLSGNTISRLVNTNGGSYDSKVEGVSLGADYSTITISKNQISELANNCTGSSGIQEIDGLVIYYKNGNITASNNMISITNEGNTNTMSIYGIRDKGSEGSPVGDHKYFYNSVYIGGSPSGSGITACFRRDVDQPVTLVNNIFFNERSSGVLQNYAVVINSNDNSYLVSHHNDLFTKFPAIVCSVDGGMTPLTFAGWKSAFSPAMDASSSSVNPYFSSIANLRITANAFLDNTGSPSTGISDDIDGNPRSLTPDPGINEFTYTSYTVGSGGHFVSLKHAFDRINNGTIRGYIHLTVISNISNDTVAELHKSGTGSPAADYTFILIQPGGALASPSKWWLHSQLITGPMIILDGAYHVTFDGRLPGVSSGSNLMIESRDLAGQKGEVFRFQNGANENTIKNCIIKANNAGILGAIHFGSSGSSVTGNSNNTIDNCEITYSVTQLQNAIYCDSTEHLNTSNIIQNCNIYDWREHGIFISRPTFPGAGWIDYGNDSWMITGNNFYRSFSTVGGTAIELQKGNSHAIQNNFIGGSEPGAVGDYSGITCGIAVMGTFNASASQPDFIEGNTIRKIKSGMFRGIYVDAQNVDIGTYKGNIIGDSLEAFSIFGTGQSTYGIYILNHSDHVVNIRNNMIANVVDSAYSIEDVLAGIGTIRIGTDSYLGCNGEIFNNRIFDLTDLTKSYIFHSSTFYPAHPNVFGMVIKGSNLTVRNNKIYNLGVHVPYYEGIVDTVAGIWVKTSGSNTIYNNAISMGSYSSGSTHDAFFGILDESTEGSNNYYFNTIDMAEGGAGNLTSTFCFLRKGTVSVNILNNMFINKRTGVGLPAGAGNYAIGVCNYSGVNSNHNNLYSANPDRLGTVQCGNIPLNLANWQSSFIPGQDMVSASILPAYAPASILRCTGPEELDNRGICISGITDDIYGNARENPPDLGINDFNAKVYKTWLGSTPYWDVAMNWSPLGAPSASDNVRLTPGINFNPLIRYTGAKCKDLLIEPEVTLSVNPGIKLDIMGVFVLVKYCP